jgi:ADP-ribose pyrophosphatase YjhB (NUDIX family)
MLIRQTAGCVAYTYDTDGTIRLLLIRDKQGMWTLPKGHIEHDENERDAALREVLEETGVSGKLGPLVSRIEYAVQKHSRVFRKHVVFFLLAATSIELTPQIEEGITAAAWFSVDEALSRVGYPSVREVLRSAIELLNIKT